MSESAAPPHAHPVHARLSDVRVRPGTAATARRDVPNTLDVFATHFPRHPLLPGVLLLATATDVALLAAPPSAYGWRLQEATRVRWRQPVRPGDQVSVHTELTGRDSEDTLHFRATATVAGEIVASVRQLTVTRRVPQPATAADSPKEQ
ncbi:MULTISPECIES: 3-hydroxyacyl-ACP dehydratase FabZ family protein [Streptomyces]|uniref:3-hydroxyacyl-ACP dehydratase FabZ family protein n=1 Tax=Streptomyces eurythermus TaxID=42237 RepID=A0ABW6Z4W6_9ACTN|nr:MULTISPECIES: beta-hydroxyacyl-ACP dehydratase [Streptomyces]QIS74062.1 beta-hydroxyacyl-ACP dehydratase [Streptomyces sp. DSM 40868]WDM16579.1 beta-hydroxyacyl-ACP dehydratase [Streptomyces lavenduligriseus]